MPEVKIHGISNLKVGTAQIVDKSGVHNVTRLSFEADVPPSEVARMLNFQRQHRPIDVVVQSPQAEMDLTMRPVSVTTGELAGED